MPFVEDIVVVNGIRSGINAKLEIWQDNVESKNFWLSMTKIEYIEYKFSKSRNKNERAVILNGIEILKNDTFLFLRSIFHKGEEIEKCVNCNIWAMWMKWRSTSTRGKVKWSKLREQKR